MMKRSFGAVLLTILVGLVTAAPALAVDETPGADLGGYIGNGAAYALSFQPVFPATLPTGDAPFEATFALTTASVKSGGNAFGRGSVIWPGSAASDPGPLLGAGFGQDEVGALFPKWPAQAQADQNAGEVKTGAPEGIGMTASGYPDSASGDSRIADVNVPGVAHIENVASTTTSVVRDADVTTTARVALQGVSLFNGHITIEQIRSISKTVSNGTASTQSGDVDISGMKIGGVNVSSTDDGFTFSGGPAGSEAAPGGTEPFPGASPEEQAKAVLDSLNARMTLYRNTGATSGGQARNYGVGLVFSIDNPIGGQGPVPIGHFDVILASTSSGSQASPKFEFNPVTGGAAPSVEAPAPEAISVGSGPEPSAEATTEIGDLAQSAGTPQTSLGAPIDGTTPTSNDYDFDGVPLGLAFAAVLGSAIGARYLRNALNSIVSRGR